MKVHVITTGGTIDKVYFDAKSEYQIGAPIIDSVLQRFGKALEFHIEPLLRKDSLELTDNDRDLIRLAAERSDCKRILITHGTDTMVETAKHLASLKHCCIVLTGSLQPAAFYETDAVFNIGCAIGAVQSKPPGVYVVMNGRVFDQNKVVKNRELGVFEPRD